MMSLHRTSFRPFSSRLRLSLLALAAALIAGTFAVPALEVSAAGQSSTIATRIVHGKVEDKAGAGIKGAVVYLKDDRSNAVKTAIAGDDGSYRFVQLTQNTDYELWAQADDKKSATKTISSFDSKADIVITLKIDK